MNSSFLLLIVFCERSQITFKLISAHSNTQDQVGSTTTCVALRLEEQVLQFSRVPALHSR